VGAVLSLTLLLLTAAPDAPTRVSAAMLSQAPSEDARPMLERARKLSGELRYEESVVEYQRYLGLEGRPATERAQALLELGYLHLMLEDTSMRMRPWDRVPNSSAKRPRSVRMRLSTTTSPSAARMHTWLSLLCTSMPMNSTASFHSSWVVGLLGYYMGSPSRFMASMRYQPA
jgi:hypothetical protein